MPSLEKGRLMVIRLRNSPSDSVRSQRRRDDGPARRLLIANDTGTAFARRPGGVANQMTL
jgi:hypothetical protein